MRAIDTSLLAGLVALALAAPARGEPQVSLRQAAELLDSGDQAKVRQGIAVHRDSKSPAATLALAKRVRAGLPPELLGEALEALAVLPRGPGSPVLVELVTHRSAKVRVRAIELAALHKAPGAQAALVSALDDPRPEVRSAAVDGLAALQARPALPSLLQALERGVPEAAEAVGTLAGPGHVPQLLELLDRMPFTALEPALSVLLGRRDVPAPAKARILSRLGALPSPEVGLFLRGLVAGLPQSERDPVRRAALAALEQHEGAEPPAPAGAEGARP